MIRAAAWPGKYCAALLGSSLLLGACASVPPKLASVDLPGRLPLAAPVGATVTAPTTQSAAQQTWPAREWWRGFNDETLNTLITAGLAQSPDLAAAGARYEAARAAVDSSAAAQRVHLGLSTDATRQRLSDNGLFPPKLLGFNWYNQFDAGFTASYSFDWWGRHRAEIAAALNRQRAAEAERDAAAMALATSIAAEYFGWQSDAARHELALQSLNAAEAAAKIVSARAAADIQSNDDTQRAQLTVLSARDHLGDQETAVQVHEIVLAALVGCAPAQLPTLVIKPLPELNTPLPANASLDLIARRADIAASRWRVEAALRDVAVARTGFLPDISLSALLGLSSRDISRLLEAGSAVPSVGAALHLPLFDGGALQAAYAHSQADLATAVADYRGALLLAAREVNTQLATRDRWAKRSGLRVEQLAALTTLRSNAALNAAQGITDQRPELDATQQWLALRDAQIQTQYARLEAELALIHALGGGYQMDANQ